jgi:23S rRNA (uracil1939-C5)-methyltransferase
LRLGEQRTVVLADLDDDGAGVTAAPRLHVAGALPGERATATIAHVSPHVSEAWARLDRIDTPSPDRRLPACPAFGGCGGCVLQHLAYDAQLAWKRARVERALAEFPTLAGVPVAAAVASPQKLGYRNKSKLVPARTRGALVLGAYAERTHDVVDLAGCRIVEPPLDDVAAVLRGLLDEHGVKAYDERTRAGYLRHVVLRSSHDGRVLVALIVARSFPAGAALAQALIAARPSVVGVVEHVNAGHGNAIFEAAGGAERVLAGASAIDDRIDLEERPLRLRLSATAFFQANRALAALAYAAISRGLAPRRTDLVVDAYCGVGGIALSLAPSVAAVVGVEANATAIADAGKNARLNGVGNARFLAGDSAVALASMERADAVVLNPPRKGCSTGVLAEVVRLAPRAIAYLSCNPDSLARDLAALVRRGYQLRTVTPFDMLPHTPHVEVLAVLDRRAP